MTSATKNMQTQSRWFDLFFLDERIIPLKLVEEMVSEYIPS